MSFLDVILGIILGYSLFKGLRSGLFVELASFVSLFIGVYMALQFSAVASKFLIEITKWNPKTITVISFFITFLVVVVAIYLLGRFFTKLVDFAYLGWLNKFGGGLFRVLKTILILSVLFSLFDKINFNYTFVSKEALDQSVFYNPIKKTGAFIYPSIEKGYNTLKEDYSKKVSKSSEDPK